MKVVTAMGAVLSGLLLAATAAQAVGTAGNEARELAFGNSTPPVGYLGFCARNPGDCKPTGELPARLRMTPERWTMVAQVNTYVNAKVAPESDQDLYGEPEYWTIPVDAGDCEDYLLLKKRYLEALGFPASALLITVVLNEQNEGHAVLTVAAEDGDFILDNRRNDIRRWHRTGYRFLKRQSEANPLQWVSLARQAPTFWGSLTAARRD